LFKSWIKKGLAWIDPEGSRRLRLPDFISDFKTVGT
jgi:hypothetical protein